MICVYSIAEKTSFSVIGFEQAKVSLTSDFYSSADLRASVCKVFDHIISNCASLKACAILKEFLNINRGVNP